MHVNKTVLRIAFATAALGPLFVLAGCRQDMHDEPKFFPQRGTTFYADGRSVRPQVANTVARNQLHENTYFYTGLVDGKEGNTMPFPVTMKVLERGQERYNVYCTPCHSRVGNGEGMIVQRGYAHAGDFHTARLETAPLGHFFYVISNGYGAMPDYSAQVSPVDRWAIVAYIKALQLSQHATDADIPAGEHASPLDSIAEKDGLPASFAKPWALPATATYGTPNDQSFVLPSPGSSATGTPAARTAKTNSPATAGKTAAKQ
ncbi:MAG TPA: cytochrome c [Edaphobacter sp.]|nr:cytochrome c [Edaphobacter sp.]HEU5341082.1 cytochrome c [Edaphobacter sp.]